MDQTYYNSEVQDGLRIAYVDARPAGEAKGVVLLIHGFPQTSYQFRKVVPLFVEAGYV